MWPQSEGVLVSITFKRNRPGCLEKGYTLRRQDALTGDASNLINTFGYLSTVYKRKDSVSAARKPINPKKPNLRMPYRNPVTTATKKARSPTKT